MRLLPLNWFTDGTYGATLEEVKKGFSRRSIEQLGFIKDIYTLVSLSGKVVSRFSHDKQQTEDMQMPRLICILCLI